MISADAYAGAIDLHVPFASAPPESAAALAHARHEVLAWLLAEGGRSLPARPKAFDLVACCVFSDADRAAYDRVIGSSGDGVG